MTTRDVPSAFKHLKIPVSDLARHVTVTQDPTTGLPLYWQEMAREFGHRKSETGWHGFKSLLLYCLRQMAPSIYQEIFVDNNFQPHPPGPIASMQAEAKQVDDCFKQLGVPIHEQETCKSTFYALGWDWHLDACLPDGVTQYMSCPPDKFIYYCSRLEEWATADRLSVKAIREAAGCTQWLTAGFHIGQPFVGALIALRTAADAYCLRVGGRPSTVFFPVRNSSIKGATEALQFWATYFRSWDRICPLVQSFGPTAGPQAFGWVDASTSWGCGGILFFPPSNGSKPRLYGFNHSWSQHERSKCCGPDRESTGAFETLAIYYWLLQFAYNCRLLRLLLATDCEAVALAFGKAFSDNHTMLDSIRASRMLLAKYHICPQTAWIRGAPEVIVGGSVSSRLVPDLIYRSTIISDFLSKNQVSEAKCRAMAIFGTPLLFEVV